VAYGCGAGKKKKESGIVYCPRSLRYPGGGKRIAPRFKYLLRGRGESPVCAQGPRGGGKKKHGKKGEGDFLFSEGREPRSAASGLKGERTRIRKRTSIQEKREGDSISFFVEKDGPGKRDSRRASGDRDSLREKGMLFPRKALNTKKPKDKKRLPLSSRCCPSGEKQSVYNAFFNCGKEEEECNLLFRPFREGGGKGR